LVQKALSARGRDMLSVRQALLSADYFSSERQRDCALRTTRTFHGNIHNIPVSTPAHGRFYVYYQVASLLCIHTANLEEEQHWLRFMVVSLPCTDTANPEEKQHSVAIHGCPRLGLFHSLVVQHEFSTKARNSTLVAIHDRLPAMYRHSKPIGGATFGCDSCSSPCHVQTQQIQRRSNIWLRFMLASLPSICTAISK
jgi:hypothetical protein